VRRICFGSRAGHLSGSAIGVLILLFSFVMAVLSLLSVVRKESQVANLKEIKKVAQQEYAQALANQKTGMLAVSILNELNGWVRMSSVPSLQLEHFSNLPDELKLNSISVDRPILYRELPKSLQEPFFKYSLALLSDTSVELVDSGAGKGKYVFPAFLDRVNSTLETPFHIELRDEDDPELPRIYDRWQLTQSLKKEWVWQSTSLPSPVTSSKSF